jgi:NAD-dependent SIR2 family protein deacetylase
LDKHTKIITIGGNRIGFFFGAGASSEFGIPSMKKITESFYKEINSDGNDEEKKLFNSIYDSLATIYGKHKVDLESIISVIVGLKENLSLDNIGDIGLFVLQRNGIKNTSNLEEYNTKILESLENKFKQFIRSKITLTPTNIDKLREVYFDFFRQLCQIINDCSDRSLELNDKHTTNTFSKWVFFTTNYDNVLEEYWVKYRKYYYLDLGFIRKAEYIHKVMDPDRLIEFNKDKRINSMQLIKLHGSLNWLRNSQKQIEEHDYSLNIDDVKNRSGTKDFEDDIIIYPLSQKQLYFSPYIQLFRVLLEELNNRDLWIIIGYSFRDPIIRNMFKKSLNVNNKQKILLVHPEPSNVKKLFSKNIQNQIFEVKDYFGKTNYQVVNNNIVEKLKTIC